MQVKITGKNLDVGDALRAHVEQRLRQFHDKYFEGTVHGQVILSKQRSQFECDCSLHLATGLVIQAKGTAQEALIAFEAATQHLEKQLRKYKQRLKSHYRNRHVPVMNEPASDFVIEAVEEQSDTPADGNLNPVVIAEREASVPELSVGEAVMSLEISSVPFLLFRNTKGGRTALVYRRSDGNIGWLEPKPRA